jgi:hypothetical protein
VAEPFHSGVRRANECDGERRNLETILYRTMQERNISVGSVRESCPWDIRVIPQLRAIARRHQPDIIWTNNTKSHFLVRLTGLHRRAKWSAIHQGYTREAWRREFTINSIGVLIGQPIVS